MNICHVQVSIDRSYGGPARTVPSLCDAVGKREQVAVRLVSSCSDGVFSGGSELRSFALELVATKRKCSFYSKLDEIDLRCPVSLVHDHGVWLPTNMAVAQFAKKKNVPLVITPRGMLEPWSLKQKALKKRIAWLLYQKRMIQQACLLHATAREEAFNLRALGFKQPIAVIPNGVDFPTDMPARIAGKEMKTALFVSRVHPKKGLMNLIQAWDKVRPEGWRMRVVGPDEDGHHAELMKAVADAGLADVFEFIGPLSDNEKWQAYVDADLFILPTHSENFGVVVAEAMAAGLPVITTKGAPWKLLEEDECGWWIDVGVDPLIMALQAAISISCEERAEMGRRGKKIVRERFDWKNIGEQLVQVYEWLLCQRQEKPDCVWID